MFENFSFPDIEKKAVQFPQKKKRGRNCFTTKEAKEG